MTSPLTSEVEVPLDPQTAFTVFTGEINYWWLRGPINNWDAARVREMRCEAGVGGRLLEIYDEAGDDVLVLATITAWEPGRRLAWDSAVDDVHIDVWFEPTSGGTRVRLESTLPEGGNDAGGTSFIRVTPPWLASWVRERHAQPATVREMARLALTIHYPEPVAAARWLRDAFALEPVLELPPSDDGGDGWIELRAGSGVIVILPQDRPTPDASAATHVPWVFVDDLDAHLERARSAGASIIQPIEQHGYRAYVAEDVEGFRWTFAQARPTM
jgi:uncharacterized glyoxalase superfamily protein PhnB